MRVRHVVFLLLGLLSLCAFGGTFLTATARPVSQESLTTLQIYAYRDWQATAYFLNPGDHYTIRANGEWLYSPFVGPHGPDGSRYHLAPGFYPLPAFAGGALIGRIGESGQPFYVGRLSAGTAREHGQLYLRIDDDRLGDNEGALTVEINIASLPSAQPDAPMMTPMPSR
jgi:hypothetical protein